MPKTVVIKKGLDIPLSGIAEKITHEIQSPTIVLNPTDFMGVTPRLLIKEGDEVSVGTPLFHSKENELIKFTAPVSGQVTEIKRGEKRLIEGIKIHNDGRYEPLQKWAPQTGTRGEIINCMLESGLWPMILQRPYNVIANPKDEPKGIFISGFDSSPLAPDYDYLSKTELTTIQFGINLLRQLTRGNVYLGLQNQLSPLNSLHNVEINYFQGPHPSGNVGTQIHHTSPINKGEIVWTVNLLNLIIIGRYFKERKLDFSKTIALTGPSVKKPCYYQAIMGQSIEELVTDNIKGINTRIISGNALTGHKVAESGHLGFYDHQITVIPEGNHSEFMGWIAPGLDKFSLSRTFFSWLAPKRKYQFDTNYHGELRNFVVTGQYEKVFPWDILPVQLLKAIIIGDVDLMENLGIYEVAEEDFALCEYVCTSKIESQQLIRKGIEIMLKEMS